MSTPSFQCALLEIVSLRMYWNVAILNSRLLYCRSSQKKTILRACFRFLRNRKERLERRNWHFLGNEILNDLIVLLSPRTLQIFCNFFCRSFSLHILRKGLRYCFREKYFRFVRCNKIGFIISYKVTEFDSATMVWIILKFIALHFLGQW